MFYDDTTKKIIIIQVQYYFLLPYIKYITLQYITIYIFEKCIRFKSHTIGSIMIYTSFNKYFHIAKMCKS